MIFSAQVPLPNGTPYTRYTDDIRWTETGRMRSTAEVHFYPYEQPDLPADLQWSDNATALAHLRYNHQDLVQQVGENNFRQALYQDEATGALTFILTPRQPFEVQEETEERTFFMGQFNTDILLTNRKAFLQEALGVPEGATAFNRDDIVFQEVIMRRFYNFYGMSKPGQITAFAHPNTNGDYPTGGICWGSNQPPTGEPRERAEAAFGIFANNTCMASPLSAFEGLPYWRRPVRIQLHGVDQNETPHALEIDMKLVPPDNLRQFDRELRDHCAGAMNINDGRVTSSYYYGEAANDHGALRSRPANGRATPYKTGISHLVKELVNVPEAAPLIREIDWEISKFIWRDGLLDILPLSLHPAVADILKN